MRYYAKYDESGKLVAIGVGAGGVEITKAKYDALLAEIREKADLVEQLYSGEITAEDVPAEWREEIQRRVAEFIEREAASAEAEAGSGREYVETENPREVEEE